MSWKIAFTMSYYFTAAAARISSFLVVFQLPLNLKICFLLDYTTYLHIINVHYTSRTDDQYYNYDIYLLLMKET